MKRVALVLGLGCCLFSRPAQAAPDVTILDIPPACAQFLAGGGEPTWDRALSFTACLQDATVPVIDSPDEARPAIADLVRRIAPAMRIYLLGLEQGPQEVQLRAAFALGLAHVAFLTRARSAIPCPPDLGDPKVAQAYAATHAAVEHQLEPFGQAAWLIFAAIDRAALVDRRLAVTEVDRLLVIRAHEFRVGLEPYATPWRFGRETNRLFR